MKYEPGISQDERRTLARLPARGHGRLLLVTDSMRTGLEVHLINVNATGIGLECIRAVPVDEAVTVELENLVQRFSKTVRGRIRHCTTLAEDKHVIGIALQLRLAPMEVSMLRMGIELGGTKGEKRWI